ncbi:S24 family peptidase, partial [Campylobacter jejuni]|nr:S24 family peptidase [Campylobacter jejuni]EAL8101009.1 S24 family peptidase [Campylobacter jejuni]EAL8712958.1 S24 family peptidase [Campylobacter jejuni]ECR0831743.1 S24 family peptidase [Campylobacter jejuni]EDJ9521755.1 S24 family peptidase [Campylobacter jejuni]
MQMQEVIEKLKDILASEGKRDLKTKDIAKELGIHPDTFNSMKFRNSIPYPQILNFLNQRNISINYFFYGSSPKDQLECENKYKILKLYKTNASLGGGGINDLIDSSDLIIDEKVLNFFGSKECEFITCYGESMEPLIKDGSICVIDRNKTFKNKSICVINTRDGLFIKQVLKQNDGVMLHSLNPLYKDIFYKNGDFLLIGVVIGELSRL